MTPTAFSGKEAILYGWGVMKSNLSLFIPLCLASMFISSLQSTLSGPPQGILFGGRWLLSLALQIIMLLVNMGWIFIALRLHDKKPVELREIFSLGPEIFNFLVGMCLYGLIVAAGFVLLVVPGVLWAIRFGFVGLLIIDQKLDPFTALRRSAELTRNVKSEIFVFGLLLLGLNLLGALALGIGLLATLPTSIMAIVDVYRKLLARTETSSPMPIADASSPA